MPEMRQTSETSEAGGMGRGEKTGESRHPLRIVSETP